MRALLRHVMLSLGAGLAAVAMAAETPIDQVPLASGTASSTVSPNIMFVMDTSGSMCWQVMPDDAQFGGGLGGAYPAVGGNCSDDGMARFAAGSMKYGPLSNHCNGVFYNPGTIYQLPVTSNGTSFPAAAVGATREDGYYATTPHDTIFNVVADVAKSSGGIVTGSGTTALALPSPGTTIDVPVTGCPASSMGAVPGVYPPASGTSYPGWTTAITKLPGNGYYPTAMMLYVASETPQFMGAHRAFGMYKDCNNTTKKLTLEITASVGGGFSAPANQWKLARIPFTYQYLGDTTVVPDIGFEYAANGDRISNTFYNECNALANSTPATFTFTPVTDLQNHANWFSYYRSRLNTMKTAMTLAFGGMLNPDKFRVGYTTINYSGTSNADTRYLDLGDYCDAATNCAQRQNFFFKVLSATASGSTALRNALSKAGLLYTGKLVTGARDPVQHSCQKNFSILSTDGYWNTGSGWPAADAGGYRIPAGSCTGTACYSLTDVGNQDNAGNTDYREYDTGVPRIIARPQVDGVPSTSHTLADVAMYYYKTVLRDGSLNNCTSGSTGENLCPDPGNVPVNPKDCNRYQHMNTFTIGLGVQGFLNSENYLTGGSADYNALVTGPTTNWPTVVTGEATTVDDLWHAAVNGRGEYYSAKSAASIVNSLAKALAAIAGQLGSGSAAGASSPQLQTGDANVYMARYSSDNWTGDVLALRLDPLTGELLSDPGSPASVCSAGGSIPGSPVWSAQKQLDTLLTLKPDGSTRKVYTAKDGALVDFVSANLPSPPSPEFDPSTLSQYAGLSPTAKAQATKDNLVAYLRGVSSVVVGSGATAGPCCEDQDGNTYRLFRDREHVLGDFVGSGPQFVGKSPFLYEDNLHAAFRDGAATSRRRMVYVGGNDGMLHAFDAGVPPDNDGTGNEVWAFVPSAMLPKLKQLADFTYGANHQFLVDGFIHIGDVDKSGTGAGEWMTLLVGGLGAGGRDYYALDVTNPDSPRLLWEFSSANPSHRDNMGYSFGWPMITKIKGGPNNGRWVVLLASGYNNASPGDGRGHLFVVDAVTGSVLHDIQTEELPDPSVSGMAAIANWVDHSLVDNSTQFVYGGDLNGNLWRFDISDGSKKRHAFFEAGGARQPITRRPELGALESDLTRHWIYVGTGKTLTADDLDGTKPAGTALQSFYAVVHDTVADTTYDSGPFAGVSGVVPLDLTSGGGSGRALTYASVASGAPGWYFHFDVESGEKMTTDPTLQVGRLVFGTTTPSASSTVCDPTLTGRLYFVRYDPNTWLDSPFESWEIANLGAVAITGAAVMQTEGTGQTVVGVTDSKGNFRIVKNLDEWSSGRTVRRVSWRELVK